VLVKQLMNQLHSKKGQKKTCPLRCGCATRQSSKKTLMKPLRSRAVEQSTLSSPLRILTVADGDTAT
jgi:hypothetical protein